MVLKYSFCELLLNLRDATLALAQYRLTLLLSLLLGSVVLGLHHTPGPYQELLHSWEEYLAWCGWWVGLGILSSVGLGTGLHTFLLYLGPHIAAVTMAAYECGSLEFPSPPYPAQIVCPETPNITETTVTSAAQITIWAILSKVRVEAFCWGAGTAIGELPPYFMARAARLSGSEPSEEEEEFHELQEKLKHPERLTRFERMKYSVQQLVEKVGFFGILACASIPNPLFDLAGITCGHFLIPFWTFFGATLIGRYLFSISFSSFKTFFRQGCHQDAHPEGVRDPGFQQSANGDSHIAAGPDSRCGIQAGGSCTGDPRSVTPEMVFFLSTIFYFQPNRKRSFTGEVGPTRATSSALSLRSSSWQW